MYLLRNKIDITRVPFSNRGSRLLVFKNPKQSTLYVKLAERLIELDPGLEAYLNRPPYIRELEFIDEKHNRIEFSCTSYPHELIFESELGEFGLVFQDERTLSFGLPPHLTVGIRFLVTPYFWQVTERAGSIKSVRNLAFAASSNIVHHEIKPEQGGYSVEILVDSEQDSAICLTIRNSNQPHPEPLPFAVARAHAEERWKDWFESIPEVDDQYQPTYAYAWWVMMNNLISPLGNVDYEAMFPSKINYIGLWLWDSAMHALAFRYIDPQLARDQIRAMLAYQMPDGMLPDVVYDEGIVVEIDHPFRSEVTKPPILAWAALKLHEMDPDPDFLKEIYVPLVRWNAWWTSMNDDDADGLVQYNHPYSSGLDDSPLWDGGMPVESPDLNTYLCVQMGSLASIAEILGMVSEGQMWRRRAGAIVQRMIEDMWDEEAGVFWASHENQPIRVLTPFNLYPIWTGQLPEEIKSRLLAHLTDPQEFWGQFVIPTVARNDPNYDPQTMWRGPVWANINYFFIEALKQVGEHDLAYELRQKTLRLIMQQPSIYEYYNAETGDPPETAANIFGWTAAVFIDLAIQATNEKDKKSR